MLTNIEEIKRRMLKNYPLINRGDGWLLGRHCGGGSRVFYDEVPADLVALLGAQGFIKTELRLVGSAQWVGA